LGQRAPGFEELVDVEADGCGENRDLGYPKSVAGQNATTEILAVGQNDGFLQIPRDDLGEGTADEGGEEAELGDEKTAAGDSKTTGRDS